MNNLKQVEFVTKTLEGLKGIQGVQLDPSSDTIIGINTNFEVVQISEAQDDVTVMTKLPESLHSNFKLAGSGINCNCNSYWFALEDGRIWDVKLDAFENYALTLQCSLHQECQTVTGSSEGERIIVIPKFDENSERKIFIVLDSFYQMIEDSYLDLLPEEVTEIPVNKNLKYDNHDKKEVLKPIDEYDNGKIEVSFNFEGTLYLINFLDNKNNCRQIHMYSGDGELEYLFEQCSGLRSIMSYRPNSNMISTVVQNENNTSIQFYEKIGLRFTSFDVTINLPKEYTSQEARFVVDSLDWSWEGTCLLISGHFMNGKYIALLYTSKNYHWHCKQVFTFDCKFTACWHCDIALKLRFVTTDGLFEMHEYSLQADYNSNDICVINGNKLYITPFNFANIPPPNYGYKLIFKYNINECSLSQNKLLVRTAINEIIIIDYDHETDTLEASESRPFQIEFQSISYKQPNRPDLYCKCYPIYDFVDQTIVESKLISDEIFALNKNNEWLIFNYKDNQIQMIKPNCESILYIFPSCLLDNKVYVKDECDNSFLLNFGDNTQKTMNNYDIVHLNKLCITSPSSEMFLIQLDEIYRNLWINGKLLFDRSCTSILIHSNRYLLATTTDHYLKIFEITQENVDKFDEKMDVPFMYKQKIEHGAKLLVSSQKEGRVILEMPRGNIETVSPRILLLNIVERLIDEKQYGLVFNLLKKHRINLNLLVDHNQNQFLTNIRKFVRDVSSLGEQEICLFLSELNNDYSSRNMFPYYYNSKSSDESIPTNLFVQDEQTQLDQKADRVCYFLRKEMKLLDEKRFYIPILLTYIKKSTPEIGTALKIVYECSDNDLRESSIKYLKYLIDVNNLFNEALGTYNLDIALMIAYRSNKDPKEFLPFIEELRNFQPEYYRHYKIDMHLKRYENALKHLCNLRCQDYLNEILLLIDKQKLYLKAINYLNDQPEMEKIVWSKYGEYLLGKKYHEEALLAFKRGENYSMALKACQLSGDWQQSIRCAISLYGKESVVKATDPLIRSMLKTVATSLADKNNYIAAAFVWINYLDEKETAVDLYIEGQHWNEAFYHIDLYDMEDKRTKARIMLDQHYRKLNHDILTYFKDLFKHCVALPAARQNKLIRQNIYGEDNDYEFEDDMSIMSGSTQKSFNHSNLRGSSKANSLKTNKTKNNQASKNARKYKLRENSPFLDLALVNEIRSILIRSDLLQNEVHLVLKHLVDQKLIDNAIDLQNNFQKLVDQMDEAVKQTWTNLQQEKEKPLDQRYAIDDPDLEYPPELKKINWKLALFDL